MPNPFFKFKQFTIYHDRCAMKVGTDGVLLGAWVDVAKSEHILDIGTGTGLITLMLAQRQHHAMITAIEIDEDATAQAKANIAESPFAARVAVIGADLKEYAVGSVGIHYDLIVSNPPYFIGSKTCKDKARTQARHSDSLSLRGLLTNSLRLLMPLGRIALVLPYDQLELLETEAATLGLYIHRRCDVHPTQTADPKRILVELRRVTSSCHKTEVTRLTIELARHQYSKEYIALTREFYLELV